MLQVFQTRFFVRGLFIFSLIFTTVSVASCKFKSDEKLQSKNTGIDSIIKTEPFNPSPDTSFELIDRTDGYFDSSIAITYTDQKGKKWIAPEGTITDGASIPTLFEKFFGGRLNKDFLLAAIIHDAYCALANEKGSSYQIESWQNTHHMFYNACIDNGTDKTTAATMYAAVRLGGPRWSLNEKSVTSLQERLSDSILIKEMEKCNYWIQSKGDTLTLDDVDKWMDEREKILLN